ncbi:hypothetical protein BJ546DRAFT_805514, partial [Cryomyces antarcticus]
SSTSARNGATTIVTPGSSKHAGTMNSKLLPPPVGNTTTSGVCPANIASIASS